MKFSKPYVFVLHSPVNTEQLDHLLPEEVQIHHAIDEMENVRMLDTFERTLQRSEQLLLQNQHALYLVTLNGPFIVTQACPKEWRFPHELPDGEVKDILWEASNLRAFLEIGTGQMQTGRILLLDDEEKTYARVHLSLFERDNHAVTIGTTQPLQGYEKSHCLLVKALKEQGASPWTKQGDLYRLLGIDGHIYCSKPPISLAAEEPAYEAAQRIIRTCLEVARHNEAGIIADYDTEFLHDYRVSLRKVRSVLSLFKGVFAEEQTAQLKHTLAGIMKHTNRLRDLDVYLLEKEQYFSMVPDTMHDGLRIMFDMFAQERQQELERVAEMLQSDAYRHTVSDLVEQFRGADRLMPGAKAYDPTLPFGTRLIRKRYKKVCHIGSGIRAETPDEEVHRLRIHCKKLRYLMEFFTPLFAPKTIKTFIKALKRLQDNLGRFNDFSVQQRSLQQFLEDHSNQQHTVQLAGSIGALITVLHQRQQEEHRKILNTITAFDSPKTRNAFHTILTQETMS